MKAIRIHAYGAPDQLYLGEYERPEPGPQEILVKVKATALNRADLMQRSGQYPPPAGESPILGLEMAGEVAETGQQVSEWKKGDRVCGLLGGGGYAEYATIHQDMALPIPDQLDFESAAAIPEVFLTGFQALFYLAQLKAGQRVLIHAGASGVGTAATQMAKAKNIEVLVTASAGKHELCLKLGASQAIDYKNEDFEEKVMHFTNREGVDAVIDFIAAPYFHKNIGVLRTDGTLVLLALMGGAVVEKVNLGMLMKKRLRINASTLRSRSLKYKIALTRDLRSFAWPLFHSGQLQPIVDSVFDWEEVVEAHRYMEANKNQGKIVLRVS